MAAKQERDVEKEYSKADFVAKLRRLADDIENGVQFENLRYRSLANASTCRCVRSITLSMSALAGKKRSNSRSSGSTSNQMHPSFNMQLNLGHACDRPADRDTKAFAFLQAHFILS